MKGLLGINYSQHLADDEDYEDDSPADDEEGGDKNIIQFLWAQLVSCVHYRWPHSGRHKT